MPNGNLKFNDEEFLRLEKVFTPFSIELEEFALRHNLLIDKYWHQFHSWRFTFKNPKGGVNCLEFSHIKDSLFIIYSFWWLDDYDKFTRFHYKNETKSFDAKAGKVNQKLKKCLNKVLTLQLSQLTEKTDGFEHSWKIYSKEEFYKLNDRYPIFKF